MRCPFLQETTTLSCDAEPGRLLPMRLRDVGPDSPCTNPDAKACPVFGVRAPGPASRDEQGRCRHLRERPTLTCTAAATRNYVPFVQGLQSRCQSDAFRYCPLYLARESPEARLRGRSDRGGGLLVATDREYSPNHMWIDEGESGICHVGVDAFVCHLLQKLDVVHFVTRRGVTRPQVVLAGDYVHLDLEFPVRMEILATNVHVRREPATVLDDPYGAGWLFETRSVDRRQRVGSRAGWISRERAVSWMGSEVRRMEEFARDQLVAHDERLGAVAADGGRLERGLAARLDSVGQGRLQHEFLQADERLRT